MKVKLVEGVAYKIYADVKKTRMSKTAYDTYIRNKRASLLISLCQQTLK
jgi:hypothetical protein